MRWRMSAQSMSVGQEQEWVDRRWHDGEDVVVEGAPNAVMLKFVNLQTRYAKDASSRGQIDKRALDVCFTVLKCLPDVGFREVRVRCTIARLLDINIQCQTFQAYIKFEANWEGGAQSREEQTTLLKWYRDNGSRLDNSWISNTDQHSLVLCNPKDPTRQVRMWVPRLTFINLVTSTGDVVKFNVHDWKPEEPLLRYNRIFNGTFQERMELGLFPFDKQPLKIELQAGHELRTRKAEKAQRSQSSRVWLTTTETSKRPSIIAWRNFVQGNQYVIDHDLYFNETVTDPNSSSERLSYAKLEIVMMIYRRPWFWLFNVILPNLVLTTSMLASYAEDHENLEGRCSITVTILLALVAFRYVIAERMPEISYSTLMDAYMLLSFGFVLLTILGQTLAKLGMNEMEMDRSHFEYVSYFGDTRIGERVRRTRARGTRARAWKHAACGAMVASCAARAREKGRLADALARLVTPL